MPGLSNPIRSGCDRALPLFRGYRAPLLSLVICLVALVGFILYGRESMSDPTALVMLLFFVGIMLLAALVAGAGVASSPATRSEELGLATGELSLVMGIALALAVVEDLAHAGHLLSFRLLVAYLAIFAVVRVILSIRRLRELRRQ